MTKKSTKKKRRTFSTSWEKSGSSGSAGRVWVKPSHLDAQSCGPHCEPVQKVLRSTYILAGQRSRISRTPCHRVRLRAQYGATLSALSRANTAPVAVQSGLVVPSKPPVSHSTQHRPEYFGSRLLFRAWVLFEEHGILVHLASPSYLAADEKPQNLRQSAASGRITYFLHEGGHGSCSWSRPAVLRALRQPRKSCILKRWHCKMHRLENGPKCRLQLLIWVGTRTMSTCMLTPVKGT